MLSKGFCPDLLLLILQNNFSPISFNRRLKGYSDENKAARAEAEKVLMSLGGVKININAFTWFEFDYNPTTALEDIQLSGALPEQKTHQFYPTTVEFAAQLLDEADSRRAGQSFNRHHPTEKPVSVLRPLIETFTQPGAIVLDPFAGSGSTCVAA